MESPFAVKIGRDVCTLGALTGWKGSARGIEGIELVTAHGARSPAGSEIVRLYVRMGRTDLDREPAPPFAGVAAIRLAIGQAVTQGFEEISQTRREDSARTT